MRSELRVVLRFLSVGKQNSYLTLVSDNSAAHNLDEVLSEKRERFVVAALGQLAEKQQRSIEELVQAINPSAAILGVQQSANSSDLRPIVVIARENGPSIVRQVGGEGVGSATVYVTEVLERISASDELKHLVQLIDWGFVGDSLFYRRAVVDSTLASMLDSGAPLSFSDSVSIARRLIEAASVLHEAGIIHGHITPSNIAISKQDEVFLLDPGVGVGLFRSTLELGARAGRDGFDTTSFAPEIRDSGAVVRSSDVYAIGLVLRELFESLGSDKRNLGGAKKRPQSFVTLGDLIEAMTDENPARRPSLAEANTFLGQTSKVDVHGGQINSAAKLEAFSGASLSKGKMVRITRAASSHTEEEHQSRAEKARQAARGIKFDLSGVVDQEAVQSPKAESESDPTHDIHKSLRVDSEIENSSHGSQPQPQPQPAASIPPNYFAQHPGTVPPHAYQMHQQLAPQFYYGQYQNPASTYAAANPYFQVGMQPGAPMPHAAPGSAPSAQITPDSLAAGQPDQAKVHKRSSSGSAFWASLLTLIVLCCGVYYKQSQAETGFSNEELELAWFSKRPSLMIPVAQLALSAQQPDAFAEMLVVSSIMKGETSSAGVNAELLKVAFDSRWEQSLTPEDRRVALALALTGLLRDKTPTDLQPIESTHPGVVLAIASTGGSRVSNFLSRVPADILTKLPRPLGQAFAVVINGRDNINCGDEAIRSLAHFMSRGWSSSEEIFNFLEPNPTLRLRSLAELLRGDSEKSSELLAVLLEHPNKTIQNESVAWGRNWKLNRWSELSDYSKLQLISGEVPQEPVRAENVAKLFAHPAAGVRGAAMRQAVDSIAFGHPAAADILSYLSKKPDLLNPKQTVVLAQLLESPDKVGAENVRLWLESKPPVDLVAFLLVGGAHAEHTSALDFEMARYMKDNNWQPDAGALKVLVRHPEKLVRMYAYIQTFNLSDRAKATLILTDARRHENDPNFRQQIEAMIKDINR